MKMKMKFRGKSVWRSVSKMGFIVLVQEMGFIVLVQGMLLRALDHGTLLYDRKKRWKWLVMIRGSISLATDAQWCSLWCDTRWNIGAGAAAADTGSKTCFVSCVGSDAAQCCALTRYIWDGAMAIGLPQMGEVVGAEWESMATLPRNAPLSRRSPSVKFPQKKSRAEAQSFETEMKTVSQKLSLPLVKLPPKTPHGENIFEGAERQSNRSTLRSVGHAAGERIGLDERCLGVHA